MTATGRTTAARLGLGQAAGTTIHCDDCDFTAKDSETDSRGARTTAQQYAVQHAKETGHTWSAAVDAYQDAVEAQELLDDHVPTDDPCDACGAERDEDCFPGCIGRAAELDRASSASRQHYIDTGSYLPKLPKVEVVVHRDVDGPTQTTVFLDGVDVTALVTVVDIDPGYGGTPQEWHESHQETAKKLSPDAAELVTEIVQDYPVDESWD